MSIILHVCMNSCQSIRLKAEINACRNILQTTSLIPLLTSSPHVLIPPTGGLSVGDEEEESQNAMNGM